MHEVVHLSFGSQGNELNSLFYNTQQDYFVYTKEDAAKSHVDPNVRFNYGKEYTPRSLFWEYRNGFGKWNRFNDKYEEPQSDEDILHSQHLPVTKTVQTSISSWTSRLKVPLHPQSLWTIPGWEMDPVSAPFGEQRGAPDGQEREFDLIEEGRAQFKECTGAQSEDYLDITLRPVLEKCDLVSGINLVTDFGGWSGVSASYLELMRDEYVPRLPIFSWCISRNQEKENRAVQKSRLEALLSFTEYSSLVIPLQDQQGRNDFAGNASAHLYRFETVCLLSSLRKKRVSMHDLYQDLTNDSPRANIISIDDKKIKEFTVKQGNVKTKVRNTVRIWRGDKLENLELKRPTHEESLREYWCPQKYALAPPGDSQVRLELNDLPLNLRKLISRKDHELIEQVFDMTEPYIWGWKDYSSEDDYM